MNTIKYIKCGKLYDGIHDVFFENMQIIVNGILIEEIGNNLEIPEGA